MADKLIGGLTPTAAVVLTDKVPKEPTAGPPAEYFTISQLKTLLDTIYAPITGGNYVLKSGDTMSGLLQFSGTGHFGLRLNNMTTAQRDAIGVGSSGMAIWNTTTSRFDMNIGGSWKNFVRLDGDTMTGPLLFSADNTIDIGASGATRPRTLYVGTRIIVGNGTAVLPSVAFTSETDAGMMWNSLYGGASLVANGAICLAVVNGARDGALLRADGQLFWNNADLGSALAPDIGFSRNAAGIVEVNNATTGTFRDLWARILRTTPAFTVATLPAAGTAGRRTYVTDALAPAFLAIIVGGGAVVTPVFDNGTNWVAD